MSLEKQIEKLNVNIEQLIVVLQNSATSAVNTEVKKQKKNTPKKQEPATEQIETIEIVKDLGREYMNLHTNGKADLIDILAKQYNATHIKQLNEKQLVTLAEYLQTQVDALNAKKEKLLSDD